MPARPTSGSAEQASAIVDAYLKRPEGLVYETDATGVPIYMKGLTAKMTYTIAGALAPGSNVSATVTPAMLRSDNVGDVLILDYGNQALQEAVTIATVTPPNLCTFLTVKFAHSGGAKGLSGLQIEEERGLPNKRSIARVGKWPLVNVLSLLGRYAYGRRSDQVGGLYQEMNLLASIQTFGGPPMWIPMAIDQCSWSDSTGEIWVPAGMLMAYYSDMKIRYVAGYSAYNVPDPIIRATAAISAAIDTNADFGGQVKMLAAGKSKIERMFASNVDQDTMLSLAPFMARTWY